MPPEVPLPPLHFRSVSFFPFSSVFPDPAPTTTIVVVDEVEMENWGIGGLPVEEYRRRSR